MMAILAVCSIAAIDPIVVNCRSQADAQLRAAVYAVEHDGRIADSVGPSMEPLIGNPAIVIVRDIPYTEIPDRAVVLRKNSRPTAKGILRTCHRAVRQEGAEWVLKGDNLPRADVLRLNAANFDGVVVVILNFPRP